MEKLTLTWAVALISVLLQASRAESEAAFLSESW